MLTSMMLHVMYVRDQFLHSMRACMQYNMRHSSQWAKHQACNVYLLTGWDATY